LVEIGSNNTRHLDPGDDAGGTKFVPSRRSTFSSIWCHDSYGFGLWWDGQNQEETIHDCVTENNTGSGFFYEIGYGGTVIHHNYAKGNGDGTSNNYPFNTQQICVSCAPADGVLGTLPGAAIRNEIYNNYVDAGAGTYDAAIVLFNHQAHAYPKNTRNWYVHHNQFWIRGASGTSRNGLADSSQTTQKAGEIGTSPGLPALNLFDYNDWRVVGWDANYLGWEHDTNGFMAPGARTWVGFQSRGHEAHGTVVAI
jgi:hypothetical protein